MSKPLIQIYDAQTGENIIREMNDDEYSNWQSIRSNFNSDEKTDVTPTKEQLLEELQALTAKINALEN
jgi:hypothetical protein